MNIINDNIQMISSLCKQYKVKNLFVFGSILTPRFNDDSDIDFSATFYPEKDPLTAGENFMNLYMALEQLVGRKIDLVDEDFIKNQYFKEELEQTKQLIYG